MQPEYVRDDSQLISPEWLTQHFVECDPFGELPEDQQTDILFEAIQSLRTLPYDVWAQQLSRICMEECELRDKSFDDVAWNSSNYYYDVVVERYSGCVDSEAFERTDNTALRRVDGMVEEAIQEKIDALVDGVPKRLSDVDGVDQSIVYRLWDSGYKTPLDLRDATTGEIANILVNFELAERIKNDVDN